jgi:hypothetical protein
MAASANSSLAFLQVYRVMSDELSLLSSESQPFSELITVEPVSRSPLPSPPPKDHPQALQKAHARGPPRRHLPG